MKEYTDTPFWNSTNHQKMWAVSFGEQYEEALDNGTLGEDVKKETLPMHSVPPSGIPDTYIETAEFDCLHDEGIRYGHKLENTGTKVEYNDTKGTFHGYDMALDTQIVKASVKKRLSFLRRHFEERQHEI
jgi:acetyl esterase